MAIGLATMLLIILIDGTGASGFLTDAIGRDAYLGFGALAVICAVGSVLFALSMGATTIIARMLNQ